MTKLLELRDKICGVYKKGEIYVIPALRFLVVVTVLFLINGKIGYMHQLNQPAIPLIIAAVCTFLPINVAVVLVAVFVLAHLSALSIEVCIVALLLFLLMFFLYFRFVPKSGYHVLITPMLCYFKVPEVMSTILGLRQNPLSVLATICGVVIFYFLEGVRSNAVLFSAEDMEEGVSKFTIVLQQLVGNDEMYIRIMAFVASILVIYLIRRMSVDYAWTIAISLGNTIHLLVLLLGSFFLGNTENILWYVIGTLIAVVVGFLMEFFKFYLDYTRVERVQFEDDEYYYYVKAVPKVYLSSGKKRVTKINSGKNRRINKHALADEFEIDEELLDD